MIRIHQIKCSVGETLSKNKIAKKLQCSPADILFYEIERESLDAREEKLVYSYTVLADVKNSARYLKRKDVVEGERNVYVSPEKPASVTERPVIVGFGPAGMFAGLLLAEEGCRPIIIERGKNVDDRAADVDTFFHKGILQENSNVQFGEGGAGTFSDGKLTTRIKNIRVQKVLSEFIEAGADPAVSYQHRPHIGTDVLRIIVKNIRKKILSLGGEIHFETKLISAVIDNGHITAVRTDKGSIPCSQLLLCAGHSASDTYEGLYAQGVAMIQKDFAAGVRVEHLQHLIDANQYGRYAGEPSLGPASYQLTHRSRNGRGVYSFCMCPGGQIIPASVENGSLAVNGMSFSQRDGKNANSAILVQIPAADFDHGNPLDGFKYQKELEKKAWRKGFAAPAQNISDYLQHQKSSSPVIDSSYPRDLVMEDMHALFSENVNAALEEGLHAFNHKIPHFADQGLMVGMESRSSSPIRIPRDDQGESVSLKGLYPCGEGAGYAGGIVSSAADGIFQAENIIKTIK